MLYEDVLPGGSHWSFVANPGVQLQLVDIDGGGNAAMLAYNPGNPLERLNLPDTLKCQHTFRLTRGHCLYSDMGRIFCSIVADDVGWHDAASGTCNADIVRSKWGTLSYQEARNVYYRNGRDCFLVELGKYGLGRAGLRGERQLVLAGRCGGRRDDDVRARSLECGRHRHAALRDADAGGAAHLPASAERGARVSAAPHRLPAEPRAAVWRRTTRAASPGRRTAAAS